MRLNLLLKIYGNVLTNEAPLFIMSEKLEGPANRTIKCLFS